MWATDFSLFGIVETLSQKKFGSSPRLCSGSVSDDLRVGGWVLDVELVLFSVCILAYLWLPMPGRGKGVKGLVLQSRSESRSYGQVQFGVFETRR